MQITLHLLAFCMISLPIAFFFWIAYIGLQQKRLVDQDYNQLREYDKKFELEVLTSLRQQGLLAKGNFG